MKMMFKSRRAVFILALISGTGMLLLSCRHTGQTSEETTEAKTPVTVTPVEYKSVTSTVPLPAVATFMNKNIIRATTAGIIEKIMVDPGDYISSGQLLFTIRTREAIALNKKAEQDTSLSFRGLINITSQEEGIINSISYQKGDFVQEGDEMAVVSEQNSLVFIMDVPFELDSYIEKNRKCRIILPDKRQIDGTIMRKLPEMDMQSQTIRYVVKPVSFDRLPGNLIASINIVKSAREKAVVIPKQAVLGNETQTEFWVMKLLNDSTAIKIIVNKGFENSEEVEITSPEFLPSDRIVLTGSYGLPDTARVTIIKE
jgi:multidrug efflux pump subunit AcrA (membrane-fusion protein)